MKLDFRFKGKIPERCLGEFNQICMNMRVPFTNLIDSLSNEYGESIDWWVSGLASRYTLSNRLFHYLCCLTLLQELVQKKLSVSEIITDSKAVKNIAESFLGRQRVRVKIRVDRLPMKQQVKEVLRLCVFLCKIPFQQLRLFAAAKRTQALKKQLPNVPLTLIDTFVLPGYLEKDRYYPGIMQHLTEEEKKGVYFVPLLYGYKPWQYVSVVRQLRKSQRKFILKEDYLKFKDYLFAWGHIFRIRALKVDCVRFRGVDISLLIWEELNNVWKIGSSYIALLNYRFARRLKEGGVKLALVVDWFENLVIDKGWNAGFRRFFPETELKGYLGAPPIKQQVWNLPTEEERKSAVIPNEIVVIGKGAVQSVKEFCSNLQVTVAPALRYEGVWRTRKFFPNSNICSILVLLPRWIDESLDILNLVAQSSEREDQQFAFCIKTHPSCPSKALKRAFGAEWPKMFKFVSGEFSEWIEKSDMVIGRASTTCMESLAKGIPAIIIGSSRGFTLNPIPEDVRNDMWRLCYTTDEVSDAIQFYKNRSREDIKRHNEAGRNIREDYFEPVTREAVRRFLGLQTE